MKIGDMRAVKHIPKNGTIKGKHFILLESVDPSDSGREVMVLDLAAGKFIKVKTPSSTRSRAAAPPGR